MDACALASILQSLLVELWLWGCSAPFSQFQLQQDSHSTSNFHVLASPSTASTSAACLDEQQDCPLAVSSNPGAQR